MWFSWLLFLGLVSLLAHYFEPLSPWVSLSGEILSSALAVAWLVSAHQRHLLTLQKNRLKAWPLFFICLLPVLCNMTCFGIPGKSTLEILCVFFASVREEILFRGIILFFLCRYRTTLGMFLSGIVFAAAHLLNLETATQMVEVFYQAIYALAAGLALAGVAVSFRSLLPCIGIHFMNNLMVNDVFEPYGAMGFCFWFSMVIWLACGFGCIYFQGKKNYSMEGEINETVH